MCVGKPIPLLALLLWTIQSKPSCDDDRVTHRMVIVALVFGMAGDMLLEFDHFVPGLIMFLLGHVSYALALSKVSPTHGSGIDCIVLHCIHSVPVESMLSRHVYNSTGSTVGFGPPAAGSSRSLWCGGDRPPRAQAGLYAHPCWVLHARVNADGVAGWCLGSAEGPLGLGCP